MRFRPLYNSVRSRRLQFTARHQNRLPPLRHNPCILPLTQLRPEVRIDDGDRGHAREGGAEEDLDEGVGGSAGDGGVGEEGVGGGAGGGEAEAGLAQPVQVGALGRRSVTAR